MPLVISKVLPMSPVHLLPMSPVYTASGGGQEGGLETIRQAAET